MTEPKEQRDRFPITPFDIEPNEQEILFFEFDGWRVSLEVGPIITHNCIRFTRSNLPWTSVVSVNNTLYCEDCKVYLVKNTRDLLWATYRLYNLRKIEK